MRCERCGVTVAIALVLLWAGAAGADVISDSHPKQIGGGQFTYICN
jgi:hypothetical protein